jgi:hypothetical protein
LVDTDFAEFAFHHSGEYCPQTDYDRYHKRASKVKEQAMIERTNAPGLS